MAHRGTESVQGARFRRRLTAAFVAVAAVSAGALALGAHLTIEQYRVHTATARAVNRAELNLILAPPAVAPERIGEVLDVYRGQEGFDTVLVVGGASASSSTSIGATAVPTELREQAMPDEVVHAQVEVGGRDYVVAGGRLGAEEAEAWFFFPLAGVQQSIRDFGRVLAVAWVVLVVLAALVGRSVARHVLRPVRRASAAAHALAEGLLDTRLPVGSDDELGALARDFNHMADALQRKIDELEEAHARERRFTADVAHELRTPLTALVAEAAVLEQRAHDLPPDLRETAGLLAADVNRMRRLVQDLLELSRLDAGSVPVHVEPTDLRRVAEDAVHLCGLDGRARVDGERLVVDTDQHRVERVLVNLLANAAEHGRPPIVVRLRTDDGSAVVEVADGGVDLAPDVLPRLFDRFAKGDRARSGGGVGLGLAIARQNAQLIGGELSATSGRDEGTSFSLRLPQTS